MLSPQVLLVGILAILGVSMIDAIRCLLVLARVARVLEWQSGTESRTDRLAVGAGCLAGLVLGGLILGLYVVLQPGKAASGGTV